METIKLQLAGVTGTRKERYAAKVAIVKAWLASEDGKGWLASTAPDVRRREISALGVQVADVDFEAAASYTKSSNGTWGLVVGSRAMAITRAECAKRGLVPGSGNN